MARLKIGVDIGALNLPPRQALAAAAEMGADAVEINARGELGPQLSQTGLRELRKVLDDLRLRVSAVTFRTRRGYNTTAELERRVAATKAAMDWAHKLGAGVVVNHAGRVPGDTDSEAWRLLVEVLTDLAHHGNRAGAILTLETATDSGPDMARLLATLPDGLIGVDLNPGALLLNGHSPLEAVAALGPRILHVHATDAILVPGGRSESTSLGEGSADFPGLLGALADHDYRGFFTVTAQTASDSRTEIADAVRYLRSF
ncbi:MAG: sugar phosphate isomerase/epimerase [Thermoguttaceae bacterium]|nr:sugar phosphate isomerase/epimerase [Thermoguttaceae bacterium]